MRGAAEIAELVSRGELDPVAVVEEALERIAGDADLNAIMVTNGERALGRARAGVSGRLAGVPLLVKDLIDVAGLRTSFGSKIYAERIAETTAPSVRALEAEGAIVVATTTCDEFAWGVSGQNTHWGDTQNPHRPGRVTGGSSSGNAAALAVGMGALALGTDTGGSVRIPAGACGVVGFKTPFGAITTEGVFPLVPALDTVGPMARSVEDCALAWSVLTGEPMPEPRLEGKRIGKLVRFPSTGELEPAPRDPRADDLPGEEVELPEPEADVWPVFYAGAAESHRATYPARADDYGPSIRAKLVRAVAHDAGGRAACARGDGGVAARGGGGPSRRHHRLAGARPPGAAGHRHARARVPDPVLGLRARVQLPRLAGDRDRRDPARRARPADAARSRARVGSVGAPGNLRCMVEGPAVTLDDDHAPAVRIDALEMFVDLLARVEEDGSSDAFYGRLCEAACELTSMDRAVIFRYDEAQRRVRAAGTHNLPLEVFAGVYFTVESAPIARQALMEDRVLEVPEGTELELPEQYRDLLRGGLLVCTPIAASGRWSGVILSDRAGSAPLSDAERYLLWTIGKVAALATSARIATRNQELAHQLQERIDLAREIHDGVIQRLFGVSMAFSADQELSAEARGRIGEELNGALQDLRRALGRPLGRTSRPTQTTLRGRGRPPRRPAPRARHRAGRERRGPGSARAARAVGADRGDPQRAQARRPDRGRRDAAAHRSRLRDGDLQRRRARAAATGERHGAAARGARGDPGRRHHRVRRT